MEKFEDNVRDSQGLGQGLGHCKYAYVIPGFAIRDSQPDKSFIKLGFFEQSRTPTVKLTYMHFHRLPLWALECLTKYL